MPLGATSAFIVRDRSVLLVDTNPGDETAILVVMRSPSGSSYLRAGTGLRGTKGVTAVLRRFGNGRRRGVRKKRVGRYSMVKAIENVVSFPVVSSQGRL